jgi:uncharacterized small protein (DUF1192 family)
MGAAPVNAGAMDLDDLFPRRPDDPLTQLMREDLDPLSLEELDARVALLQAEIERVRAKRASAAQFRASADQLFKK